MSSFSDYLENEATDHLCGTAYTPVATVYLALVAGTVTDGDTGATMSEVANSNGYARTAITFGAAGSAIIFQNADVTFPKATGSWGLVERWAVVDSATHGAGNVLFYGNFDVAKTVVTNSTLTVPSGDVGMSLSGEFSEYAADKLLDLVFRNQAFSVPGTWIGLSTGVITSGSTGSSFSEVSGGSYARVQINPAGGATPRWTASSGGSVNNDGDITFPTATADWGNVKALAILDASTAGNILFFDNNVFNQDIDNGDTWKMSSTNLSTLMT